MSLDESPEGLSESTPGIIDDARWVYENISRPNARPTHAKSDGARGLFTRVKEDPKLYLWIFQLLVKHEQAKESDQGDDEQAKATDAELTKMLEEMAGQEVAELATALEKRDARLAAIFRSWATAPENLKAWAFDKFTAGVKP